MQNSPDPPPQGSVSYGALANIQRQLERLEDRTRNLATRDDLDAFRKEVVAQNVLDLKLSPLIAEIARIDKERIKDREDLEKRMDKMITEQMSRSERLWARLGPAVGVLAFLLTLFEFLTHLQFR